MQLVWKHYRDIIMLGVDHNYWRLIKYNCYKIMASPVLKQFNNENSNQTVKTVCWIVIYLATS
jgi:hypothetical protein